MPVSIIQGSAAKSSVIWKWNEQDASQFQVAFDAIAPGATALTVPMTAAGPVLRVTFPTKVTGQVSCWITITDPELVLPKDAQDRYRYVLRLRCVGFSGTRSEWYSVGNCVLCNRLAGGAFYGLAATAAMAGGATRLMRAQAGVIALSAGTPAWEDVTDISARPMTLFEHDVVARHVAGSAPAFNDGSYASMRSTTRPAKHVIFSDDYIVAQLGAFGGGWGAETLDSCGIAILGGTGTTAGQYFDFDCIEVLRHPMDG